MHKNEKIKCFDEIICREFYVYTLFTKIVTMAADNSAKNTPSVKQRAAFSYKSWREGIRTGSQPVKRAGRHHVHGHGACKIERLTRDGMYKRQSGAMERLTADSLAVAAIELVSGQG